MAASIDPEGLTGDELGLDQEENGAGDLEGPPPAAERRHLADPAVAGGREAWWLQDRPRSDRVDQDRRSQLERQTLGQPDDACLRDVVREVAPVARAAA